MRDPFDLPSVFRQLSEPVKTLARLADFIINSLQPTIPPSKTNPIKIVSISDSHSLIPPTSIPVGDVLIHAGDLTNKGTPSELQAQIDWLDSLPHRHKIVISGNHDTYLDPKSRQTLPAVDREGTLDWKSVTYLQDTSTTLTIPNPSSSSDGKPRVIKIHGSPHIPACGGPDSAFQYPRSQGQEIWDGRIPADVDVLVTHTPPRFHLDLTGGEGLGDSWLLREVRRVRPRVHVFGHVHAGKTDLVGRMRRGREVVRWDFGMEGWFERVMERQMEIGAFARVVDVRSWGYLVIMICCGIWGLVRERISTRKSSSTIMVNASLMYRNSGQLLNPPQELVT